MPTFNRAYILPVAIKSVLEQTHENWEMLIIDDGSTDATEKLIADFDEPRIRYFRQENQGPWVARNRGLELSKGAWITFLDSDNEFLPRCIERCLAFTKLRPET